MKSFSVLKKNPVAAGIYTRGRHFSEQPEGWCWPHILDKCIFPGGENIIDSSRKYHDTLRRHLGSDVEANMTWKREHWHGVPFEPEAMDRIMREMLAETKKVELCLGQRVIAAKNHDGILQSVTLDNGKSFRADAFIDATGDGVLCRFVGCEQHSGLDAQSLYHEPGAPEISRKVINGVTLIYRVTPTDIKAIEELPEDIPAAPWWQKDPIPACVNQYPNGDRNFNMLPTMEGAEFIELGYDKAYKECLRRTRQHWHFIQAKFPEFQHYRRCWTAPFLGIRESYRTVCEKMLTENDIITGINKQQDPDIIALADHALDRHGEGGGCPELEQPYGIPYRSLIPKGFNNLLIACRAAGFSSIAATSCRLSRTMMQLGQAAGTAVGICRKNGLSLTEVPYGELRQRLREEYVQLEFPMPMELQNHIKNNG